LLDKGADINVRNKDGQGIVVIAANNLKLETAMFAIENGADYKKPDNRGVTPLSHAIKNNQFDLVAKTLGDTDVNQILNKHSGVTLLLDTIDQGDPKISQLLLNKGGDISIKNKAGATALHYAANSGNPSIIDMVLARGAEVDAVDNRGETALFSAITISSQSIVQKLLAMGSDMNHQTNTGLTPLMLAVNKESTDITSLLLIAGADPAIKDNDGATVFDYAKPRKNEVINAILNAAKVSTDELERVSAEQAIQKEQKALEYDH
ncbi:MAG: ankyrin repeat domain-containing protein, partial [Thiotrichaceae bacterium]|nr:ankyrin repeat domain-containing protein [Thiotrichaceae bacterium]